MRKFIVFEGVDRSGKTTQAKLLVRYLKKKKQKVLFLREPGGTPVGEKIRNILKNGKEELSPLSQALLFMASRSELVDKKIKPALQKGITVVLDRYYYSTCSYQGAGGRLGLGSMISFCGFFPTPDVVFIIDVDPRAPFKRKGKKDRFEKYPLDYHLRVRDGFLQLTQLLSHNFMILDGLKDIKTIHKQVINNVI